MARRDLSRREFVAGAAAAGGLMATRPAAQGQMPVTAAEIIARMQARVGVPWRENTVDGLKAGNPAARVTGIAVAVMPTFDVLRRASRDGCNLVIALEPTFYTPTDTPGPRATDPVYLAKKAFIDEAGFVIYRFTDHWHARRPHPSAAALASALGWANEQVVGSEFLYAVPATTLAALAAHISDRLAAGGGVRIVGRPDMPVRTAYVSPGTTGVPGVLEHIARADVVIAGEPREWEAVPYIADTWPASQGKGMVAVGRVASQEAGARLLAVWIKSVVPELSVESVSVGDPYWSPDA